MAARAGLFIPKSGVAVSLYDGIALAGLIAFNASSVLVYLLVGWTACSHLQGRDEQGAPRGLRGWWLVATISILILALLSLLRLTKPFGPIISATYQTVYLVTLLSCASAVFFRSSLRWWTAPVLLQFSSQLCAMLFVTLQSPANPDSRLLLGLYRAGEFLFLASAWAFLGTALWHAAGSATGKWALRRPIVLAAGVSSALCGSVVFALHVHSPYPRQIIMFATGLTTSGTGAALFAASFAAALFGLALCMLGKAENRRLGICFFLVIGCGYSLELTHYYVLRALGLLLIARSPFAAAVSASLRPHETQKGSTDGLQDPRSLHRLHAVRNEMSR